MRPTPLRQRSYLLASEAESLQIEIESLRAATPDMKWLARLERAQIASEHKSILDSRPYFCVMPGAAWKGKRWSIAKYAKVIESSNFFPVILGAPQESESLDLIQLLEQSQVSHLSGVGVWSLPQVARVLSGAKFYFGNDTGLAHLAEAVGTRAYTVFGPTVPDMGFGPWKEESKVFGSDLWCRPCGKDGRNCHRPVKKYLCLEKLDASEVTQSLNSMESERARS